jgi:hypothetical protein
MITMIQSIENGGGSDSFECQLEGFVSPMQNEVKEATDMKE